MYRMIRPYRWKILLISILAVLQALLLVSVAVVMKYVIDSALTGGNLPFWGAVLIANLAAIVVTLTAQNWICGSCADKFSAGLRKDLLIAAAHSRDMELQSYHSGELLSRGMEDVNTVCDGAMNVLPTLFGQATRLVASFVAVILIQPMVALILLLIAAVMGTVAAVLRPIIKRQHRQVRETDEKVLAAMQEDLQQLELIQSLQMQPQVIKRFDKRLKENLRAKFVRRSWIVGSNSAIATASYAGTGAVLLWGAGQLIKGAITYGDMTSILELLTLFRGPVLGISGQWTRLAAVEVACERLMVMLKPDEEKETSADKQKLSVQAVVFENVTFSYSGENTPVLQAFSARFPLDGWTCLTGISGKGKTTMFKLMLGLYKPQQGRVYLETDKGEIPCSETTRHLFAYVPQDYAMFSGTVLENMQLVAPDAGEQERREAIRLAEADFIWETAAGEQTHVGENNTGLSKGQIQRLAIARAILMQRQIFLLDECTSALDAGTEDAVLQNMQALGKSAILVTHRPQAVADLDHITFVPMDQ